MAPMKRPLYATSDGRSDDDDEGESEEVEVLEQASSNLRAAQPVKRQRLSVHTDQSDESELDVLARDDENDAFTSTQRLRDLEQRYLNRRDDPEDIDSADEARLERKATQSIRRHQARNEANQAAECGVLEEIVCENFMCHKHLRVTFGPLINFIIGHNGSGKSAVLTAITLCLGAKPTSTNRGQNLKGFIKEGAESATLSVKIKNQGENSYKHDQYGDSIIVERHFTIHKTSGFKLRSADRKIISTKRSDLDEIADYYALQLDNPVNVLNQDMARQFLHNSTPSEKYKFYLKGVQLEQLDHDYNVLEDSIERAREQVGNVEENVGSLRKTAAQAKERQRMSEMNDELRNEAAKKRRQVAWVQIEDAEKMAQKIEQEVTAAEENIKRQDRAFEKCSEQYESAKHRAGEADQVKQNLIQESGLLQDKLQEAKEAEDGTSKELTDAQAEAREMHNTLASSERRVQEFKGKVEDEERRLEEINGGSHAQKVAELAEARAELEDAKNKLDEHQGQKKGLENSVSAAAARVNDVEPRYTAKKDETEQAEKQLERLIQSRDKQEFPYDSNLPRLLKAIENHRGFQEKPVGPAGKHVRLLRPEWSSVIESTFGGGLRIMVVTNQRDQNLLSRLMKETGCRLPIVQVKPQRVDTRAYEPDEGLLTILRCVEIDNDHVRLALILNHYIEKTVLIPDRDEAYKFMFEGSSPPRNVHATLCHHTKDGCGTRYSSSGGNQKADGIRKWTLGPRMRTDIEYQISAQDQAVRTLKLDEDALYREKRDAAESKRVSEQALNRWASLRRPLITNVDSADDKVSTLSDELESQTSGDGSILTSLNEELQKSEKERDRDKSQLDDAQRLIANLMEKHAEKHTAVKEAQDEADKIGKDVASAEKQCTTRAKARENALSKKNEADEGRKRATRDRADKVEELKKHASELEEAIQSAMQVSERVEIPDGATHPSLCRELDKLAAAIKRADNELGGDRGEIARAAHEALDRFKSAHRQYEHITELTEKLMSVLSVRNETWRRFRQEISIRAKMNFVQLLKERGFRGNMTMDHVKKELDMTVEPDPTRRSAEGRQTKTLSGGEKSFSTICMLLALWDAMGSPIRCLDEFDVFMDSVNRKKALDMILGAARKSIGRQYIFITPQSMENVSLGHDVKVIRLSDPERGQTTLDFGRASAS